MLFHNETEGKIFDPPQKHVSDVVEEDVFQGEELASTQPLLTPQTSQTYNSLAEHANLLATPVPNSALPSVGGSSPFVLLEEPQVEVEIEADITLEEAEEAKESPLHKRLSMSLITCHEGAPSSQIFAEVHRDSASSPAPSMEVEPLGDGVEHSYALPSDTEPESTAESSPVQASPVQPEEAEQLPAHEETKEAAEEPSAPPVPASEPPAVPSPEQPQPCKGIRCPTIDSKSPSQVVFKPQWLGKGFGASGLRARGVQAQGGKGGSSPLAVRVAVKNATNENKTQSGKLKQKGVYRVCGF